MDGSGGALLELLTAHGVSRRAFLQFSTAMAGALALPRSYGTTIAAALSAAPRVPVIWLEGQDCAGNTEGFLRASHPTTAELVLGILSVDYHETIMAPAGKNAEKSRTDSMNANHGKYICVVEGAIPVGENGSYCTIGGRPFSEIAQQTIEGAVATIAVGSCAFDGGLPAASGGPTGAIGAKALVPGATVINLPGCPMNVQNLTATVVHFLTFGTWPALDTMGRPLFAYGQLIHDQCERRAHFDAGEFVTAWGDEAHRKGWCLYKMGCKGPETYANCPTARFNDGASWPVKAGHGCVGCTMPGFWDQMSPFYRRLPSEPPLGSSTTADQVGLGLVGFVTAASAVHGVASYARKRRSNGENGAPGANGGGGGQPEPALPLASQYRQMEGTER
ncbi:MAG TPA: hydrogenase small subunit [Candidatus Dormibacteraeota bacterium]|nr:hydrogenase small subunit [Candidatus Dormibacteraeota bacterium]